MERDRDLPSREFIAACVLGRDEATYHCAPLDQVAAAYWVARAEEERAERTVAVEPSPPVDGEVGDGPDDKCPRCVGGLGLPHAHSTVGIPGTLRHGSRSSEWGADVPCPTCEASPAAIPPSGEDDASACEGGLLSVERLEEIMSNAASIGAGPRSSAYVARQDRVALLSHVDAQRASLEAVTAQRANLSERFQALTAERERLASELGDAHASREQLAVLYGDTARELSEARAKLDAQFAATVKVRAERASLRDALAEARPYVRGTRPGGYGQFERVVKAIDSALEGNGEARADSADSLAERAEGGCEGEGDGSGEAHGIKSDPADSTHALVVRMVKDYLNNRQSTGDFASSLISALGGSAGRPEPEVLRELREDIEAKRDALAGSTDPQRLGRRDAYLIVLDVIERASSPSTEETA